MDRNAYEKLSIRESAKCLKRYGSTSSKNATRNENYMKHYVTNTDTLQGIALRYNVTIEKIRRANKLWASDSLFLKEFLLIPIPEGSATPSNSATATPITSPESNETSRSMPSADSFDEDNISEFLEKIDASIASTKEEVKKTQINSNFVSPSYEGGTTGRRKQLVTRINNNGSTDFYSTPQAVVVHQGKRVKSSIQRHEKQQDEIFEL